MASKSYVNIGKFNVTLGISCCIVYSVSSWDSRLIPIDFNPNTWVSSFLCVPLPYPPCPFVPSRGHVVPYVSTHEGTH